MSVIKKEIDICRGCLCIDRVLMPLNKNIDLFFMLLGNELSKSQDLKYYNIFLCWECIALLKRAEVFRKRVQKAHKYFEQLLSTPSTTESLSNLKTFQKDNFDVIIESVKFEPKVKPEAFQFEINLQIESEGAISSECQIKKEDDDDDYSLDNEELVIAEPCVSKKSVKKESTKKGKHTGHHKIHALNRIKTTPVKYTEEERERSIEIVTYSLNYILEMEKDKKNPKRIKNMENRSSQYINKLLEMKKQDINKAVEPEGITCSECDTKLPDHTAMKAHWDDHPVSLFKCKFCDVLSKYKAFIKDHIQKRHSIIYACTLCNFEYRSMPEYYTHYRGLHRSLICDYCGKKFNQKSGIARHIRRNHLPLNCEICDRVFKCIEFLDNHMAVLHPNAKWRTRKVKAELRYCVECDKHFPTAYLYKRHLSNAVAHARPRLPKSRQKFNHSPAACLICNFTFKRKCYLERHNAVLHPEKIDKEKVVPKELTYCVECDLQFPSDYSYRRHLLSTIAHKKRSRPKAPCPDCGKVFSRKTYMDNHYKMVHARKSQHYCELCDKLFINGYAVRKHMKYVHEKCEKPKNKICDICGRGFHTNRVLNNHKRTHTGERPFQCTYCPAAFARNIARVTHEKTQHKKNGPEGLLQLKKEFPV